jgi:hypothetical protein
MSSTAEARINSTAAKIDAMIERFAREDAQRRAREAAEQARADADYARENVERRRQVADRYGEIFRSFGTEMPPARDDESAFDYRRRLFARVQRKLPNSSDLASIRADELDQLSGKVMSNFERQLFAEAAREAAKPSVENLPPNGDLVRRVLTDEATGAKTVEFHGTESFIKQMGNPLKQRVM